MMRVVCSLLARGRADASLARGGTSATFPSSQPPWSRACWGSASDWPSSCSVHRVRSDAYRVSSVGFMGCSRKQSTNSNDGHTICIPIRCYSPQLLRPSRADLLCARAQVVSWLFKTALKLRNKWKAKQREVRSSRVLNDGHAYGADLYIRTNVWKCIRVLHFHTGAARQQEYILRHPGAFLNDLNGLNDLGCTFTLDLLSVDTVVTILSFPGELFIRVLKLLVMPLIASSMALAPMKLGTMSRVSFIGKKVRALAVPEVYIDFYY